MQADGSWADTDLSDLFYRFERQFDFECSLEEWTEELGIANVPSLEVWENEVAPRFTFGAIARFIQKRASNPVSFAPVTVINKECRPAGIFYGMQQLLDIILEDSKQISPSTKIIDVVRGRKLDHFWGQLRWMTENGIPELSGFWKSIYENTFLYCYYTMMIGSLLTVVTQNIFCLAVVLTVELCGWCVSSLYKYCSDPLPPELQTFRDLAVAIAGLDCEAVRGINVKTNRAGEGAF
ncbi:hypothetical protein [Gimesia panareensis]|nr:hypothetical protein [Gimesia panareensis]